MKIIANVIGATVREADEKPSEKPTEKLAGSSITELRLVS